VRSIASSIRHSHTHPDHNQTVRRHQSTMVKFAAHPRLKQSEAPTLSPEKRTAHFANEDLEARLSPISDVRRTSADASAEALSIRSGAESISRDPTLLRRANRSLSGQTVHTIDAVHFRPSWHAGQEPGLDPSKPNGGRLGTPILQQECQITLVDYSESDMQMHYFDNASFIEFLQKPKAEWVNCRWINVNGLSWDIIQAVGKDKHFHKLAIEDLINTHNRTKADW
jgi:hypothetical protein